MIQNGRPVFDHRSQKLTGSERIGITRRSDPPLRAGTYFVSVLVFDTGVVAEGTLTATVETDAADCHLDATCYPEWSSSASGVALIAFETSEGSYACSGTLLNNRRQDLTPYFLTAAHCVDTEEEARSVTAFWLYQTQTCNGDLPDLRSVPQTEGAGLISTFGGADRHDGDMTLLQLEGDLPDAIVFQGWDADPQPVGAQVTGIHHPRSDDWGFFKRIAFGQIIPESVFGTTDDTYFNVSYPVGQGYTERGSSGSAIFSNSETVVGALSGGDIVGYACPTEPVVDVFTHFSVFYPHIRPFIDSTLPEISGGALPPGQPAAFRLGPVDAPMLFSGDSSFQVEVPEGATRVTFTLESIDPDVNVDLYVRYGEDNAIQDGNVVSDYSSEGSTGNEQIVVTRQSDPPLRAGTYFVSLMLRTTGAVAEVTVTAEFDAPPPTGGQIYYFPHLAVGQKWQTTITYINYSAEEVSCRTDFLSDQGTPLMVSFADKGTVPSRTDVLLPGGSVLLPGGSVHQETNVELNAPVAPGWARATCSGPVKASLLFRLHNSEGVPIAEGGVNAAAVPATRFVTFAEQGEGKQGTGVAYANPSATEAVVTFTAKDALGQTLASVDKNLLSNEHAAQNMAPLFALSSFTGSLEVTSTVPIVSLSINAEAAPVFSSLPPGELDAALDIPGEMLAPADEAAFNDLVVGKRVATNYPTVYVDFVSPGRFRATEGADTYTGSYTFQNTGSNTGTLTFNYDDGDRCTTHLTFASAMAGTATFTCNDGSSGAYNWRLVEIPASGAPDLVIQTPSVSDSSPNAGGSFTFSATVRNQGNGLSASTTLRYYRSPDATISTSDTAVGTDAVGGLAGFWHERRVDQSDGAIDRWNLLLRRLRRSGVRGIRYKEQLLPCRDSNCRFQHQ